MHYTMSDAKRDFRMGHLGHWEIQRALLETGWRVYLGEGRRSDRSTPYPLVDARSKEPRLFKTLDACVSAIEEVGFEVNLLS
jgi:hypothetical protein